jgi:hypothetical protein
MRSIDNFRESLGLPRLGGEDKPGAVEKSGYQVNEVYVDAKSGTEATYLGNGKWSKPRPIQ